MCMTAYLDHAATTPMLDSARRAMSEQLGQVGNPSSLHGSGRRVRMAVEEAREAVAVALRARPADVIFTAGGTEANNLAIKGLYWRSIATSPARHRILASSIEHHAVLDPVQWLHDDQGANVEWVPVDASGRVDLAALGEAIEREPESVALVTVMWANNEIGTVQPVADIARLCARFGIPFHTDAVQATSWLDIGFDVPGLSALTISGHKVGGPHGSGALLLRGDLTPMALLHGGGQERDVRSGTVDAPSAVGLATALTETVAHRERTTGRIRHLRDDLIHRVRQVVPEAILNGPESPDERLANNAHFSFPGCEGDALLLLLDAAGVECSTGSACTAGIPQPSHVLLAIGADAMTARSSLRFSLGSASTASDVDALIDALPAVHARAQRAGLVGMRS
jgi:cysteine desulfurase